MSAESTLQSNWMRRGGAGSWGRVRPICNSDAGDAATLSSANCHSDAAVATEAAAQAAGGGHGRTESRPGC
jgi:hypothetical protein